MIRKYSKDCLWIELFADDIYKVGIINDAADALGDVVYIELRKIGDIIRKDEVCCTIESVKAASDFYLPIDGEITDINKELLDNPYLIKDSPYDKGWLFKIKITNKNQLDELSDEKKL